MIKKLKEHDIIDPQTNKVIGTIGCDLREIMEKLNEVIDVTNRHEDIIKQIGEWGSSKGECLWCEALTEVNLDDPYAEQRKWIGKLCRFWNFKDGSVDIGILKAVDNLKPTIPYINDMDCSYAYCEPVKPDDDIIYKGGDNE